jgi:uncharacterized repeat protein (TIGR01451 family)
VAQTLFGQQPQRPSQNFTPARTAPPSVHVPPQGAAQLGQQYRQVDASQFRDSAVRPTSYTFSDRDRDVQVPEILAGKKKILPQDNVLNSMSNHMKQEQAKLQSAANSFLAPPTTKPAFTMPQKQTSNSFSSGPQVNQSEFAAQPVRTAARQTPPSTSPTTSEFADQPFGGGFKAPRLPKRTTNNQPIVEEFDLTPPRTAMPPAMDAVKAQPETAPIDEPKTSPLRSEFVAQPVATEAPVQQPEPTNEQQSKTDVYGPIAAEQASPSDTSFVAKAMPEQQPLVQEKVTQPVVNQEVVVEQTPRQPIRLPQAETISVPDAASTPLLQAAVKPSNPPQQRLANFEQSDLTTNTIRTVSNETTNVREQPQLTLRAPAIQVDAFGPRRIGVNKTGSYKIVVQNQSNFAAEDINVGIALPNWIEVRNVNLSAGSRTNEEGEGITKLVWNVKNIPANSSHTMMIDAIPTQAKMFDVGIEWAMVPRIASTNVDVTQPRLAMKISGPNEVQFGEKAIYEVTVSNPGTGTAENVTVKLPQALGGEQAPLHDILPGDEKKFQVELLARTAGELDLTTLAIAEGGLETAAGRQITVRRAALAIQILGPPEKYAGTIGYYNVTVANNGDAPAREVMASIALPPGVKYLSGIESVEQDESRVRWKIGTLGQSDQRTFKIKCELNSDGRLRFDAGVRGEGELAAAHMVETNVQTVADLVLSVADPKGPLPIGEETEYTIRINNRGSRAARQVNLVMQFSKGIDPTKAAGLEHKIMSKDGQVLFAPIEKLEPGQEVEFTVTAVASNAGTHIFRAQLVCDESDSREVAEGTTKFFGEPAVTASSNNGFQPTDENQFKR